MILPVIDNGPWATSEIPPPVADALLTVSPSLSVTKTPPDRLTTVSCEMAVSSGFAEAPTLAASNVRLVTVTSASDELPSIKAPSAKRLSELVPAQLIAELIVRTPRLEIVNGKFAPLIAIRSSSASDSSSVLAATLVAEPRSMPQPADAVFSWTDPTVACTEPARSIRSACMVTLGPLTDLPVTRLRFDPLPIAVKLTALVVAVAVTLPVSDNGPWATSEIPPPVADALLTVSPSLSVTKIPPDRVTTFSCEMAVSSGFAKVPTLALSDVRLVTVTSAPVRFPSTTAPTVNRLSELTPTGLMGWLTVIGPAVAEPILSTPAMMRSSSASDRPRVRGLPLSTSAPPRSMSVPTVSGRSTTVLAPACTETVEVRSIESAVSETVGAPVAPMIPPAAAWIPNDAVPPPPVPVTEIRPPLEAIREFVPVIQTPLLSDPVPDALPPVPVTVTLPLPPAVIWPPDCATTPRLLLLVPAPPPMPVTVTSPPLEVIWELKT